MLTGTSELGDFAAAAMYFGRMASSFAETRWNLVEDTMLRMYAQCLKKLHRTDDYIRTLLDLLAKSAAHRKSIRMSAKLAGSSALGVSEEWLNDDEVDTTSVFTELVAFSEQLPYDKTVPMSHYFGDISVEPYVRHYDDKDGFQLRLQFRHVLEDDVELKNTKVRLISATSAQGKDIWLESSDVVQLKQGMCRIWLGSNVSMSYQYCHLANLPR